MLILLVFYGFINNKSIIFAEEKQIGDYNTNDYFNYQIFSENNFFTVNKITNKIEHFNNATIDSFGQYGNTNGTFTEIKFFRVLKNGEFVVLDSLNRLQFFDSNFNFLKVFQHISVSNSFVSLGNIEDITTDIYSNIYLVDSTHNYILKANSSMENLQVFKEFDNLTNSKITFLNNSDDVAILQANTLSLNENCIDINTTCHEIFSDALNFIYLVCDNQILKYNNNLSLINTFESELGLEYNINLENGKIFYFKNNELITISNFASDISNFTPPNDINDTTLINNPTQIYTINASSNLLSNPYSNECVINLNLNDKVILLANTENFEINFAYVLYLKDDIYYLGYLENKFLTPLILETTNYLITPIRNDINYYKFPTSVLNKSPQYKLIYDEKYTVVREIALDNKIFLEIKIEDNFAYVLNEEVLNTNLNYINTYLNTNAKLNLYNGEKQIIIYDNINKENPILTLTNSVKVKIIKSFNNMTKISLLIDNQIITGYVETRFIKYESNYFMPLAISLMLISILLLVVLIIKFKKESTKRKLR